MVGVWNRLLLSEAWKKYESDKRIENDSILPLEDLIENIFPEHQMLLDDLLSKKPFSDYC